MERDRQIEREERVREGKRGGTPPPSVSACISLEVSCDVEMQRARARRAVFQHEGNANASARRLAWVTSALALATDLFVTSVARRGEPSATPYCVQVRCPRTGIVPRARPPRHVAHTFDYDAPPTRNLYLFLIET